MQQVESSNICMASQRCYSARRLIGSRIIESAAYCNQMLLVPLYLNSTQKPSVNWIIRLMLSLLCWPKVILLSGGHCILVLKCVTAEEDKKNRSFVTFYKHLRRVYTYHLCMHLLHCIAFFITYLGLLMSMEKK